MKLVATLIFLSACGGAASSTVAAPLALDAGSDSLMAGDAPECTQVVGSICLYPDSSEYSGVDMWRCNSDVTLVGCYLVAPKTWCC